MEDTAIIAADAREKAIFRLETLALKAERKGDLKRAMELRRRARFLEIEMRFLEGETR